MDAEGKAVKKRRDRLGMTQDELAKEAQVNRDTLGAIEAGKGFRRSSLTKIENALDRLEEEAGFDAPPTEEADETQDVFEFTVINTDGLQIVAKGPLRSADELKRQVVDIIREIRGVTGDTQKSE